MAEQLFKRYTGGKTLHQLRHPADSPRRGERQRPAADGHQRAQTAGDLEQYVKPSQAAVAALMAASDPDRRGR